MTAPFKKRRIVLPQHMEQVTSRPAESSTNADAVIKPTMSAASSSSKRPLLSSKHSTEAALVHTKYDIIKVVIGSQKVMAPYTIMQVFATCQSQTEAIQAIRSIREVFAKEAQNERRVQTLVDAFVRLDAISTILKAMTQWKKSTTLVSLATDVLKVLLFHMPTTGHKSFLQHGGTRILMEACEEHWFLPMIKAAFAALSNVASSLTHNTEVIEECLAFVMKSMQIFDANADIQRLGSYFYLKLAACAARSQNDQGRVNHIPEAVSSRSSTSHVLKRKLEPSRNQ
ncbi:unnamed protein product [Cylindrotheca closterium]|uniref:Uncharacterized protein n=1 Tax=Cylindrotheca closterium TaxID=2856 RepID=A0AAD2CKN4_9STRA|nr:unnamed protein product [Cylindrotheca closterium]